MLGMGCLRLVYDDIRAASPKTPTLVHDFHLRSIPWSEMSAVWWATWRTICPGHPAPPSRQTALSIFKVIIRSNLGLSTQRMTPVDRSLSCNSIGRRLSSHNSSYVNISVYPTPPRMNLRSKGGSHREKSTFSVPKQSPSFSPCAHFKSLSQAKITEIYGIRVSVQRGNDLLRVLQDQRLSGTLDYGVKAPGLDPEKALSWLRTNHPIDEDAAISARLDREEIQAEQTDRLGVEESGTYKPQQGAEKASVYGDSVIDRVKKYNEKRVVEKHQKEEESRKSDKGSQVPEDSGQRAVVARRTESAEWVKRYKAKATSDLKEAPRMTKFQRLWGSTVVTFAVVGLSILFAQHYMLPARRARIWPDIPPAAATIIALIGINVAVFLVWRLPQTWRFMNRYFMLVPGYPHSFSIIGNTFSHQGLSHLAMNMAVLWFVGTRRRSNLHLLLWQIRLC